MRSMIGVYFLALTLFSPYPSLAQLAVFPSDRVASAKGDEATKQAAPQREIEAPLMGYVFDGPGGGIRPILGIPGSSSLSDPLISEIEMSKAEVLPGLDAAFGVSVQSDGAFVLDLTPARATARRIAGTTGGAETVLISPRGDSGALYDRQSGTLLVIRGLPASPGVLSNLDLGFVPGIVTAMALADGAALVGLAVSTGAGEGGIYAWEPGKDPRFLTSAGRVSALGFLPGTRDLLAADVERDEVLLIRDAAGAFQTTMLANRNGGVAWPVAVAASDDGQRVFVANGDGRDVVTVAISTLEVETVTCGCRPSELSRLHPGSVFRITKATAAPLFVMDASESPTRMFFVARDPGEASFAERPRVQAPRARVGP